MTAREGLGAWLLALGAFLIYVSTWGLLSSYGTYQSYDETTLLRDASTNAIAWIGTVEALLLILGGVVTGPIYDAGYVREMICAGTVLTVFGVMMLSLATEYYQIMLTQGVAVGIGSGIVYPPSITLVAATFGSKYRGLAVSFATCGTTIGGIVFPILLDHLLPSLGFAWATRVLGFMTLVIFLAGLALILPGIPDTKTHETETRRRLVDLGALTEPVFVIMCLGIFFLWIAYWVPFFLIPTYAEFGLGASSSLAFYLLVVANASGIPGRLLAVLAIP